MTARVPAWLLPPIVLQVVHFLDMAIDVLAFLHAVPPEGRDEALDALMTLLAQNDDLWPEANVDALAEMDRATAIKAFPLFRKLHTYGRSSIVDFCKRVRLLPSTAVRADIFYDWHGWRPVNLEYQLDDWVLSLVELTVSFAYKMMYVDVLGELISCPRLETLTIDWDEMINLEQVDEILSSIGDSYTCFAHLRISAGFMPLTLDMEGCTGLFAWVAKPSSRRLKLQYLNFSADAAKALASALVASTTLHTIELLFTSSNLVNAFVDLVSRPLPRQLRKLTLMFGEDWDDMESLAAKLAVSSVERLDFRFGEYRDVTRALAAVPPTLRRLELSGVEITSFPLLPALQYLQLHYVEMTNDAVAGLAAFLGTSTHLFRLDLEYSDLPADQLEVLLVALPRWLSRQKRMCIVRLSLTSTTAMLLAAAMVQTRNTQPVQLEVCGDDDSLPRPARLDLLTALGATSHMRLQLESMRTHPNDDDEIQQHCKAYHIEYSLGYFLSPRRSSWTLPLA